MLFMPMMWKRGHSTGEVPKTVEEIRECKKTVLKEY